MVTYDRADYVRVTLPKLLETCGEGAMLWLWHNGDDEYTLDAVRPFLSDPRVARFHHSRENQRLWAPINWILGESNADFCSKVDDDCILPSDWIGTLSAAHGDVPAFGVLGSWRFRPEDFRADLAAKKMHGYPGGHTLLRNHWVQGSGYLMKRECIERCGLLRPGETFPGYCVRLAQAGWVNGWLHPFVQEEHLDDPRSPHTRLRTDEDLIRHMPLTAQRLGVRTLAQWEVAVRRSAYTVQAAPLDLRYYQPWRRRVRSLRSRLMSRRPRA